MKLAQDRNPEVIRSSLQRWRDMLKYRVADEEARKALEGLIAGAEKRLAEMEGRAGGS